MMVVPATSVGRIATPWPRGPVTDLREGRLGRARVAWAKEQLAAHRGPLTPLIANRDLAVQQRQQVLVDVDAESEGGQPTHLENASCTDFPRAFTSPSTAWIDWLRPKRHDLERGSLASSRSAAHRARQPKSFAAGPAAAALSTAPARRGASRSPPPQRHAKVENPALPGSAQPAPAPSSARSTRRRPVGRSAASPWRRGTLRSRQANRSRPHWRSTAACTADFGSPTTSMSPRNA